MLTKLLGKQEQVKPRISSGEKSEQKSMKWRVKKNYYTKSMKQKVGSLIR
jgi:hypothetical protein